MPLIGKQNQNSQSAGLIIRTSKKESPTASYKKGSFPDLLCKLTMIALARSLNSSLVFFFCFFRVAARQSQGLFFQSYNLSIQKRFYVRNISKALAKLSKLITKVNVSSQEIQMCITHMWKSVYFSDISQNPKVPIICLTASPF